MQGTQEGQTAQQEAGEVIWTETHAKVRLLRCRAGGKTLGKWSFFRGGWDRPFVETLLLERAQSDSSPTGE